MKTPSILLCLIFICFTAASQGIAIIPEPVSVEKTTGVFALPESVIVEAPLNKELETTLSFFERKVHDTHGK